MPNVAPYPPVNLSVGTPPARSLLSAQDFVYLGAYKIPSNTWGQGFLLRRVGSDLRCLSLVYKGAGIVAPSAQYSLREYVLPSTFNATAAVSTTWTEPWGANGWGTNGHWFGLGWVGNVLITSSAVDYLGTPNPSGWFGRTLNSDGTIGNLVGPLAFSGVTPRKSFGKLLAVPAAFQQAYGVGPYALGGGGYVSTMCVDSASLGPTLFAVPDPTAYWAAGSVPSAAIKTLMDHAPATCVPAWYPQAQAPTTVDRGWREPSVQETYDTWTSPAPDGLGRWTWGDSAWGTATWIDTPTRYGVVYLLSLMTGAAYYQTSTLHQGGHAAELQVFDPERFAEVVAGTRPPAMVSPASRAVLSLPNFRTEANWQSASGQIAGADYDPQTNRLYAYVPYSTDTLGRVHVWQVPAKMAFVPFYLSGGLAGASDLNAGSTTGGAAVYTSTNGNWDGTSVFTPTDGSTPASSIAAGDYVSVYLDAASVTPYVAKVSSVAAGANGAITLDTTIKYGTAPTSGATGRSVKAGGTWATDQVLAAGGLATTTVPQSTKINIKGNLTIAASRTISMAGATTTPLWFSGYNANPGDLDSDTTNSLAKPIWTLNSTFLLTTSGAHQLWSGLSLVGSRSGTIWAASGTAFKMVRCRSENTSSNAAAIALTATGLGAVYAYSWFKTPTTATTTGTVGITTNTSGFVGCVAEGGGLAGFNIGISCCLVQCIGLGNTGSGFLSTAATLQLLSCTVYNSSSDGIKITTVPTNYGVIAGCLLNLCGGYGINQSTGANTNFIVRYANDFYSCTPSAENGFGDSPAFFGQTDTISPVMSATDLRLVSGVNARRNGFPGLFEAQGFGSFVDIGAVHGEIPALFMVND